MTLDFRSIVEDALGTNAPDASTYAQGTCGDQWIADCLDGGRWDYRPIPSQRNEPAVLLILESPHIDEFSRQDDGTFQPIGPAAGFGRGKTGYRIHTFLRQRYLHRHPRYAPGMPIYLVNAVQYQCSLARKLTKKVTKERDTVFTATWQRGGMDDFITRLSSYYRPGDMVVNACTGNKKQAAARNLKLIVEIGVVAALDDVDGRNAVDKTWGTSNKSIRVISDMGIHHPSSKCFERMAPIWTVP